MHARAPLCGQQHCADYDASSCGRILLDGRYRFKSSYTLYIIYYIKMNRFSLVWLKLENGWSDLANFDLEIIVEILSLRR